MLWDHQPRQLCERSHTHMAPELGQRQICKAAALRTLQPSVLQFRLEVELSHCVGYLLWVH